MTVSWCSPGKTRHTRSQRESGHGGHKAPGCTYWFRVAGWLSVTSMTPLPIASGVSAGVMDKGGADELLSYLRPLEAAAGEQRGGLESIDPQHVKLMVSHTLQGYKLKCGVCVCMCVLRGGLLTADSSEQQKPPSLG